MPNKRVVHFYNEDTDQAACGQWLEWPDNDKYLTEEPDEVTCKACQKTSVFKKDKPTRPTEFPFVVDDNVIAAFKYVSNVAREFAGERFCSQYDQAVRYINGRLPEGVGFTGMYAVYRVWVSYQGQKFYVDEKAKSKKDAIGIVDGNLDYLKGATFEAELVSQ